MKDRDSSKFSGYNRNFSNEIVYSVIMFTVFGGFLIFVFKFLDFVNESQNGSNYVMCFYFITS